MFNQEQLAAIAVAWHMLQQQEQQQQQQGLVNHQGHLQQSDLNLNNIAPSPPPLQHHPLQQQQPPQTSQQQHALVNNHHNLHHLQQQHNHHRGHLQQVPDLSIAPSPPLQHRQQQQALVNHHRAHLQQPELNIAPSPPLQQHQQMANLVNHYQAQLQQQSELNIAPSPPQQQQQQQQQPQQPQQRPQQPQQQVLTSKPRKPESYSAIVAKFNTNNLTTGSSNNNGLGQSNGSLLNHHQSNLLALEQTTINYNNANDHSTSPAQQLFQHSQNLYQQAQQQQIQPPQNYNHSNHTLTSNTTTATPSLSSNNNTPSLGSATNLLGFMGLYVGNLSPDLTKEQLEKIFSKYGEPVKAHRLIRSPVAFIKYENTESPRAAIDDLYGLLLPELTLNQDQPLKLHFDRNDAQLKANYRPTELPPKADNGECYGWRTTVCRRGKNCPKKHIPINRGIDFQMWMIKSTPATTTS